MIARHRARPVTNTSKGTSPPSGKGRGAAQRHDSYEVGYGKPPKHTQFKPGQSGNPKGRKKGKRNLQTDLEEELCRRVKVTEEGQQKSLTLQQLVVKNLVRKAAKGETRSEKLLLELIFRTGANEVSEAASSEMTPADKAILDRFLNDELNRISVRKGTSHDD